MRSLYPLLGLLLPVPGAPAANPPKPVPHPEVTQVDRAIKGRLTAAEQKDHLRCPAGFAVELVAADPLVINPVTMTVDEKGRIYVSESHTYRYGPTGTPVKPFTNPVVRLDPAPDGKGYRRTVVAEGFDDPVMGIAVKGDRLWLTANNYLFTFNLGPDGKAINKRTLITDRNKAWNPFGMFVLEWGPDGLLYLSVGDHSIHLKGPAGELKGRGHTGFVMRMNPDGTNMEYLVHGLRVPYSFEFDPFGQLWLLSNGEGNPNRFLKVIEGLDYHCYTRNEIDNNWLAGNHPLAPPCFESPGGAHTQLLRYYGAAYPTEYRGNLFLDNWGRHGFAGANRAVFRYVPDLAGRIVAKEPFLWCTDPHFRPAHICLDPEGNLLVADWYGRDDESDLTGRIWRVRYVGKDAPPPAALPDPKTLTIDDAVAGLGSPHHRTREICTDFILKADAAQAIPALAGAAAKTAEPLGAAHALWVLARIGTREAKAALASGTRHPDPRIRRMAAQLLRRYRVGDAEKAARRLGHDDSPAVRVAAALALPDASESRQALLAALRAGAAADVHLRYEAAWHIARLGGGFKELLADRDADVGLAGLIAVDVACYESFPSKADALVALKAAVAEPAALDATALVTLVQLHGDASFRAALQAFLARPDLPPAVVGRALLFLRSKGEPARELEQRFAAGLADAVDAGRFSITKPDDLVAVFALLEAGGPTPSTLRLVGKQLAARNRDVREAAHALARRLGRKAGPLARDLWAVLADEKKAAGFGPEAVATLALIETPNAERWRSLLVGKDPAVRTEAVRTWRAFKDRPELVDVLLREAPALLKVDPDLADDLGAVTRALALPPDRVRSLALKAAPPDPDALARATAALIAKLSSPERARRAALGQQVFERAGCVKCHTTATQTTELAPSLRGIGGQKAEYLVESVLYPSKVIKTGFETETVQTTQGRTLTGLVREDGNTLLIRSPDATVRVLKTDVETRTQNRVSIMPEGLAGPLGRREFEDLIAYLSTLR